MEEINAIDTKWNKGKVAADKLGDNWGSALDGKTEDNYKNIVIIQCRSLEEVSCI